MLLERNMVPSGSDSEPLPLCVWYNLPSGGYLNQTAYLNHLQIHLQTQVPTTALNRT